MTRAIFENELILVLIRLTLLSFFSNVLFKGLCLPQFYPPPTNFKTLIISNRNFTHHQPNTKVIKKSKSKM